MKNNHSLKLVQAKNYLSEKEKQELVKVAKESKQCYVESLKSLAAQALRDVYELKSRKLNSRMANRISSDVERIKSYEELINRSESTLKKIIDITSMM